MGSLIENVQVLQERVSQLTDDFTRLNGRIKSIEDTLYGVDRPVLAENSEQYMDRIR